MHFTHELKIEGKLLFLDLLIKKSENGLKF